MESISNLIYFENNRSTVPDPLVTSAMAAWSEKSEAEQIKQSQAAWNQSLGSLASLVNCQAGELMLTPGTSPSIEWGIELLYRSFASKGRHIITSAAEHPVVLNTCAALEKQGARVTRLGVDREGITDPDELKAAIADDTILVCLMAANNETGVLSPIEKIAEICRAHHLVFFCDASQFVGKEHCDLQDLGVDCMAFGAHKMYGPKGIGALFLSNRITSVNPSAGAQFNSLYQNFPITPEHCGLAAGFGTAADIARNDYWTISTHVSKLRNHFEHHLLDIEGLRINGSTRYRLYTTSNLYFPEPEFVLPLKAHYDFLSNHNRFSHVLSAMGLSEEEGRSSFRFSFGKYNTLDEVKTLVRDLLAATGSPHSGGGIPV